MKFLITILLTLTICACSEKKSNSTEKTSSAPDPTIKSSLVRVNSTIQHWSIGQPWDKTPASTRRALGILLSGNRVLTTAEMAANATYIELENAEGTRRIPAKVSTIDYEANLALITASNDDTKDFFKDLKPIALSEPVKIGSNVEAWQLEDNGMPIITHATIQSIDIVSSFISGQYFLTYEAKGSMQSATSSFSVPIINQGKLLGLLTSYNAKDQIIDIIAPEIIAAFLKDTADGKYLGFPSLGIAINNTVDPNFRSWLKLPDDVGGLYVTKIRHNGPAEKAGLEKEDVIIAIDDKPIGRRGYYSDEIYGRLYWSHLIRGAHAVGDTIELTILRKGEKKKITATLARPGKYLIPRHTLDQAPRYLVKGGLVFQELTGTYLKAYGKDWQSKAPLNLLDILSSPEDYEKGRNRIVILSATIPTPATTGYERLRGLVIDQVNGKTIADIPSLIKAFQSPDAEGLHTIDFLHGPPKTIYLDAAISDIIDAQLLQRGIPALSRQ